MTVEQLMDTISPEELVTQAAFFALEPWGEWREDFRIAQLCALIANVNRDPKKRSQPYTAKDFMMFEHAEEEARNKDMKMAPQVVMNLFAAVGRAAPPDALTDRLRRVAPHLSAERIAQMTAGKHAN